MLSRCRNSQARRQASGFSLIEVLISLVILAVGLLGMTALQNEALKYNHAAFTESQALFLIADMTERIRANRESNNYTIELTQPAPTEPVAKCNATPCTSTQMAAWDIYEWRAMVEDPAYLPNGNSAISFDTLENEYTITVSYEWTQLGGLDIADGIRSVSVTTRIE